MKAATQFLKDIDKKLESPWEERHRNLHPDTKAIIKAYALYVLHKSGENVVQQVNIIPILLIFFGLC